MVQAGQISHNPNLGSEVSGDWTKLGENVGVGYDVDGLMQAFINSPAHYKNLVDPDVELRRRRRDDGRRRAHVHHPQLHGDGLGAGAPAALRPPRRRRHGRRLAGRTPATDRPPRRPPRAPPPPPAAAPHRRSA